MSQELWIATDSTDDEYSAVYIGKPTIDKDGEYWPWDEHAPGPWIIEGDAVILDGLEIDLAGLVPAPGDPPVRIMFRAERVGSDISERKCKCNLKTKLVGDGCSVCNPELAAEYRKDD